METAVPAFVGYTPRADYEGKSYFNQPVQVSSLAEYLAFFGARAEDSTPAQRQYRPSYSAVAVDADPDVVLGGQGYAIQPDPGTIYYLYNAIRLFYLNGGGSAFICSVGPYGAPTGQPLGAADPLVNPNVTIEDLRRGLDAFANKAEPTMLLVPDANLLPADYNGELLTLMIQQCGAIEDRVALLDVPSGRRPDPERWPEGIEAFRTRVGTDALSYGIAYYPYLHTTVSTPSDLDYRNLGGGDAVAKVLPDATSAQTEAALEAIRAAPSDAANASALDQALRVASPDYAALFDALLKTMNVLPPCPAMAGIYTAVDRTDGVWQAPANVSVTGAVKPTLPIGDAEQADLNVDAITGKSINAIRLLPGRGVLVWGARTLDGNSQDWRYINVRRTLTMIEQSAKLAARAFVFEPNHAPTWSAVASMLTGFLTKLWKQGALQGASAQDAFSVEVGLGVTMTAQDILDGRMNVAIKVAVTHPAEFIVITFSQIMQAG